MRASPLDQHGLQWDEKYICIAEHHGFHVVEFLFFKLPLVFQEEQDVPQFVIFSRFFLLFVCLMFFVLFRSSGTHATLHVNVTDDDLTVTGRLLRIL